MKTTLLLCMVLAGCATPVWVHPTKDAAAWERDMYECEARFAEVISRDPLYGSSMRYRCMQSKGWQEERK
jgi:hypothetical protein